jgi:hyaluronan synthase
MKMINNTLGNKQFFLKYITFIGKIQPYRKSIAILSNKQIYLKGLAVFRILLGVVIIIAIFLVKSKTIADFSRDPILYIYGIFVSVFLFFRISGALLYKASYRNIINGHGNKKYEPAVSFIIPAKNEEKSIGHTIEKCFAAEYPTEKLEVIVINDGSTDSTEKVIRELKEEKFPNLHIISFEKNQGKRHAMAEGFRKSKGEIIIQLDSDSYIDPATFKNLIIPFANKEIGAVCAHADPTNIDENFITKVQAAYYLVSFRIMKAAESTFYTVFCCSGCSSAYRKSAVMPILDDWLNEKFMGAPVTWGDDRALTSWLLKNDYKTIYTDQVQAYTIVPNNFRQLCVQQLRWKKSWIINSIFTGKFIFRKQPFVSFLYYYPLIVLSYIAPIFAVRSLVVMPIINGNFPYFYLTGIMLITALVVYITKTVAKNNKYTYYFFIWQFFNTILFSFVIFYALVRINDRRWGTR